MIKYVVGDVTNPIGEGDKLIIHVCNNINRMGAGVALALSKKWPKIKNDYHLHPIFTSVLGNVLFLIVSENIAVANMIAQHGIYTSKEGIVPIRYDALKTCLKKANDYAIANGMTIHCPRIGCGLAGGDWKIVEKLIEENITVDTFIYDLKR